MTRPDLTLINLNLLMLRYADRLERDLHIPLGPLYLTAALERSGFCVDFRDYPMFDASETFALAEFLRFAHDPAPIVGFSCMKRKNFEP